MSKFSFLLPAYKTSFLNDAVVSILSQTYDDFTVIVSDDCSPNDVASIVKQYEGDGRVKYRRNPVNIGAEKLADHWNQLLESCNSEYVIVASDDDVYCPLFLEEIEKLSTKYPMANVLLARADIIDGTGRKISEGDGALPEIMDYKQFVSSLLDYNKVHCVGNYVFKTSALKSLGGFVKFPLAWKSDTATAIALAEHGVPCTSDILFSFRRSGDSITTSPKGTKTYDTLKLQATDSFFCFLEGIRTKIENRDYVFFKRRLCGEMQSYYWTLGFIEFVELYAKMIWHNRFTSFRNATSFFCNWFGEKRRIKKSGCKKCNKHIS